MFHHELFSFSTLFQLAHFEKAHIKKDNVASAHLVLMARSGIKAVSASASGGIV